jgi:ElaB/YqjD/DUF883 family membrane-anchored ribosome-binding protein
MVSQAVLEENWNDIKATLKSKWQQLSDHDLRGFKGSADDLVEMIPRRTGQAKTAIENQLEEMVTQGRSIQKQVGQYVSGAATQASEAYEEGYDLAAQKLKDGYKQASRYAKENPGAAVAILLGSGILAGLGLVMLMRRKS